MPRTGPVTKDPKTLTIGFSQIRIGSSADNIANIHPALGAANSIGALAQTKLTTENEYLDFESGFPKLIDKTFVLKTSAMMEIAIHEMTPKNLALSQGKDITSGEYATMTNYSGEIPLGAMLAPDDIRMESRFVFPDGDVLMYIIFPRGQVKSSMELDYADEDVTSFPLQIIAQRADSEITGGNAVWDDKPLGRIGFYQSDVAPA